MPYDANVQRRAKDRLDQERRQRQERLERLRREAYWKEPRLEQLDRRIQGTMAGLVAAALRQGGSAAQAVRAVREENQELQRQRAALLGAIGLAEDALDGRPACPLCKDTGWQGARMCRCLRELCAQEQIKALTALLNLTEEQDFDHLRLDVYSDRPWNGRRSPRENMRRVTAVCEGYARQFPEFQDKNLLLSGGTGLGKTFLSGCIAREVARRGYSVVYDTAISLFAAFKDQRFARDAGLERQARDDTRRYLNCDLLILDDLGSEFNNALSQSALYEVVNGRLQTGRHTIISTNLSAAEIGERYGPQLASRIGGLYWEITFYGDDLRLARL